METISTARLIFDSLDKEFSSVVFDTFSLISIKLRAFSFESNLNLCHLVLFTVTLLDTRDTRNGGSLEWQTFTQTPSPSPHFPVGVSPSLHIELSHSASCRQKRRLACSMRTKTMCLFWYHSLSQTEESFLYMRTSDAHISNIIFG